MGPRARVLGLLALGASACALSTVGVMSQTSPEGDARADATARVEGGTDGLTDEARVDDGGSADGSSDALTEASSDGSVQDADSAVDARACDASTMLDAGRLGSLAAAGAITVNGDLSEWGCVPFVTLDRTNAGLVNPPDASIRAEFATQWSASTVYFAVRVFDVAAPAGGDNLDPHNNDSAELYLDGDGVLTGNYGANDHQYVLDYKGLAADYGPEPPARPPAAGFSRAVNVSGNNYTMEMAVTAAALGRASFSAGGVLGFDVEINNFIGTTPHAETLIWYRNPQTCTCGVPCCCNQGGDDPWCDTQRFGFLHLLP